MKSADEFSSSSMIHTNTHTHTCVITLTIYVFFLVYTTEFQYAQTNAYRFAERLLESLDRLISAQKTSDTGAHRTAVLAPKLYICKWRSRQVITSSVVEWKVQAELR